MAQSLKDKLDSIETSGFVTLLLSNLVLFATLFTPMFWLYFRILRCAKTTDSNVQPCHSALVLGRRLTRGQADAKFIERLERGKQLLRGGQVGYVILLGGITGRNNISEAQAGRAYLLQQGIPDRQLLVEDKSRHTLENLRHAREMLLSAPNQPVALVSSRYHLARSAVLADGLGLKHTLCAAETEWRVDLPTLWLALVEAYYLHWYYTGKYWSLCTNQKWLQHRR